MHRGESGKLIVTQGRNQMNRDNHFTPKKRLSCGSPKPHPNLKQRNGSNNGAPQDEEAVHFWNVFANFKLAAILLTGVRSLCEGRSDRVYSYASTQGMVSRLLAMVGV